MTAGEGSAGFEPAEMIALATAIAQRSTRMAALGTHIGSELLGVPYVETSAAVTDAVEIGRASLLLLQIEDPSRVMSMDEIIEASSDGDADAAVQIRDSFGVAFTAEEVQARRRAIGNGTLRNAGFTEDHVSKQLRA
jgi:hypothetical protein